MNVREKDGRLAYVLTQTEKALLRKAADKVAMLARCGLPAAQTDDDEPSLAAQIIDVLDAAVATEAEPGDES